MTDRVVVFIDYQNVYRRGRGAFHDHVVDEHWCGQINPLSLGKYLAADSPYDRELKEVRVYRGMPVNDRDRKGYAASRRQVARWGQDAPLVRVITRDLRYLDDEPPEEKGIDVALAVDFVAMALRKEYDVGILFSVDTDLKPALERVAEHARAWGKPRAEVAAWSSDQGHSRRLSIKTTNLYCHWMGRDAYDSIRDNVNYTHGP